MNSYLQTALMDCVLQLNAMNEFNQNQSQKTVDFMKMIHFER